MTKHLRFLIVLLMTLVWSTGWAAESVYKTLSFPDDNKASNGENNYTSTWTAKIGSDSWSVANFNNNNWNNSWKWIRCGYATNASKATITNTTAFDKAITKVVVNASEIKEVGKINSIKLETSKDANFSSIAETVTLEQKSIKQGNLTFELSAPIENGYYKLTFDCQKSSKGKNGNIKVEQVDYYIDDSKTSTTLTFPQQSLTYATDDLKSFTGQTATLTADGTALTGKTITYSKTGDEIFSSFDATNGTLALNGNAGTTKITATFAGDDTYAAASAEYTLNVIDPNKTDFTFDFTDPSNFGYTEVRIDLKEGEKLTKDGFVLENVQNGQNTTRLNKQLLRIYSGTNDSSKNGIVSLSAPAGFAINKIVFTDDNGNTNQVDNFKFSTGELKSKTWEGLANSITMEVVKNQVFLKQMIVYAVKVENVTLNESEINTIEAKALANVTLKRTMKGGVWNTICLPFDVSAEKATTAFGEGVKIAALNSKAVVDANVLSFISSDTIAAATPYLIMPGADGVTGTYTFKGVKIVENNISDKDAYTWNNVTNPIAFKGIYNMVDITTDVTEVGAGYKAAFLGANNTVFGAKQGTMKGFRAYFAIPKDTAASALRVVIDGTVTSIKNIDSEVVESNAPVYNLQGQRVDGNNLTPGIYVKAGKKFVVK